MSKVVDFADMNFFYINNESKKLTKQVNLYIKDVKFILYLNFNKS